MITHVFSRPTGIDRPPTRMMMDHSFSFARMPHDRPAGGYIDRRHLIPLTALSMPLAGLGITQFTRNLAARFRPLVRSTLTSDSPTVAVVAALVAVMLPRSLRPLHLVRMPVYQAAEWLRLNGHADDIIVSNSLYVPFFLGKATTLLNTNCRLIADHQEIAEAKQRHYVVLDCNDTDNFDPAWQETANSTGVLVKDFFTRVRDRKREVLVFANREHSTYRVAGRDASVREHSVR